MMVGAKTGIRPLSAAGWLSPNTIKSVPRTMTLLIDCPPCMFDRMSRVDVMSVRRQRTIRRRLRTLPLHPREDARADHESLAGRGPRVTRLDGTDASVLLGRVRRGRGLAMTAPCQRAIVNGALKIG